jgi:predicted nucleotide-binding protein (sugar kinase/HSP70/actin superfamily)
MPPDGSQLKITPVSSLSLSKKKKVMEDELDARMAAELDAFIAEEKAELGIGDTDHWTDKVNDVFTADQRAHTTLLVSGLSHAHDTFITAAWKGLGYKTKTLDAPNYESFRFGKEFGNRGQCSPTYFTVGHLVKTLTHMRDAGLTDEQIIDRYIFITAGACGPCRFGSYITEYRKALRDAGFEGFRVLLFQQKGGADQTDGNGIDDTVMANADRVKTAAGEAGLNMNVAFFGRMVLGGMIGDSLNALMYRIRPYEVVPGATDAAIAKSKEMICDVLGTPDQLHRLPATLVKVRRTMSAVQVDRTVVKPKVAIIGEFWAMTTEGDGNYQMPKFLEAEGAEVDVQLVTAWVLYNLWEVKWDTLRRMKIDGVDGGLWGLKDTNNPERIVWGMKVADKVVRGLFHSIAKTMGLHGYKLPDMDELASVTEGLYHSEIRGGEGHMEVAKLIVNTVHSKVNMTLSVKPFGCMPSSGVSDGVQSVVQAMHPGAIFLPVETTGDGAVNVYSRVQMMLHKARQQAKREVAAELANAGVDLESVRATIAKHPLLRHSLRYPSHKIGCTAANTIAEAAKWTKRAKRARKMIGNVVPAFA